MRSGGSLSRVCGRLRLGVWGVLAPGGLCSRSCYRLPPPGDCLVLEFPVWVVFSRGANICCRCCCESARLVTQERLSCPRASCVRRGAKGFCTAGAESVRLVAQGRLLDLRGVGSRSAGLANRTEWLVEYAGHGGTGRRDDRGEGDAELFLRLVYNSVAHVWARYGAAE